MGEVTYPRLGETVCRERLPNGLELVVVRRPYHVRRCALLAVDCGGMDLRFRQDGRWRDVPAGVAHYLEHKMFDTPTGSADREMGRRGVDVNAFTDYDMTAYYFTCTQDPLRELRALLEFVSVPWFTQESVDKERGIIGQEILEAEDDPDWKIYEDLTVCLYRDSPVRTGIVGTLDSIARIGPETLYDCHRAFYTPRDMVLVCVGDMDPAQVAETAMAVLPGESAPSAERDRRGETDLTPARRASRRTMEVSMPMFLAGFKCPPAEPGEDQLRQAILGDLACDALFGESSPLYQRLYREGLINSSLGGGFQQLPGAACVDVGGDARDPYKVLDHILTEAERLGEEGIPAAFFDQIRRAAYGGMLRGLDSLRGVAESVAEAHFRGYDYFRFPEVFGTVTRQDVARFLRENVTRERAAVSLILPREGDKIIEEE